MKEKGKAMDFNNIYAGIVLFNADENRLKENINSLLLQVKKVIVYDNGSDNINKIFAQYNKNSKIEFILSNKNNGIAHALNCILRWGLEHEYDWCLTMDQDSVADVSMLKNMTYFLRRAENNVKVLVPNVLDINLKTIPNIQKNYTYIDNSKQAISSGSLVNIDYFFNLGGFYERMFIDYVDTDYFERVLQSGAKIVRVNDAILYHEVGKLRTISFLNFKILCSNHNSFRRYYQVRNRLYFEKRYHNNFSFFKEAIRLFLGTIKIVIFEENKFEKTKATVRGFTEFKDLLHGKDFIRFSR